LRSGCREQPGRQQHKTKCDENKSSNVHVLSVDAGECDAQRRR
jgi:hypothetical protein